MVRLRYITHLIDKKIPAFQRVKTLIGNVCISIIRDYSLRAIAACAHISASSILPNNIPNSTQRGTN